VFNKLGERNPNITVSKLSELTSHLWQGQRHKGYHVYDGKIPIIATGLGNLTEHGPDGPVFFRFGRDRMQPLREAIGNPRREAAEARSQEEARAHQEAHQAKVRRAAEEQAAKKAAEREARRPVCTGCGARFTDARWEAAQVTDWGAPKDSHPDLCDGCKQRASAATVVPAATREHQEPGRAEAGQHGFHRNARRPVCTQCGADFTDERWRATERVGWGTTAQEPRPSLYRDCDQRYEIGWEEAWPGVKIGSQ
jgi:hypothetical protein